jgi:hypothetical protein
MSSSQVPNLELAQAIFQNLDPSVALKADDPRYVDLYLTRAGADPKRKLLNTLLLSGNESLQLFSGFRGSGKSTELLRLKHQLHHDHGYNVFYADATHYIGPNEPLDISLLRIAIIGSLCVELDRKLGINELGQSFFGKIGAWFAGFPTKPKSVTLGVEAGGMKVETEFESAFKGDPDFRKQLREFIANRRAALDEQINEFLVELRQQLAGKVDHKKGIVLIFDQLEQDPGALNSLSDRSAIINSAKQLFQNQRDSLKLPGVHLILTVPSWLKIVLKGVRITFVPNFPLWKSDAARSERKDEMNLMRELVNKRFFLHAPPHVGDHLAAFFAPDIQSGIDRIIRQSGGFIRDLLRLLQSIVRESITSGPADDTILTIATDELRQAYLPIVAKDAVALHRMMHTREVGISDSTDEEIARLANLMNTQMAFFFLNGDDWFDVHPLLRDEVQAIHDRENPPRPKKTNAKRPRGDKS